MALNGRALTCVWVTLNGRALTCVWMRDFEWESPYLCLSEWLWMEEPLPVFECDIEWKSPYLCLNVTLNGRALTCVWMRDFEWESPYLCLSGFKWESPYLCLSGGGLRSCSFGGLSCGRLGSAFHHIRHLVLKHGWGTFTIWRRWLQIIFHCYHHLYSDEKYIQSGFPALKKGILLWELISWLE